MSFLDRFTTKKITLEAEGCIDAQNLLSAIDAGRLSTGHAWLRFVELAAKHGWNSAACAGFVKELAKRRAAL